MNYEITYTLAQRLNAGFCRVGPHNMKCTVTEFTEPALSCFLALFVLPSDLLRVSLITNFRLGDDLGWLLELLGWRELDQFQHIPWDVLELMGWLKWGSTLAAMPLCNLELLKQINKTVMTWHCVDWQRICLTWRAPQHEHWMILSNDN